MSRLNKILLGIVLLLAIALAISWNKLGSSLSDWKDSDFASIAEIQQSGLIEKGWFPNWMPLSATKIKETHNIDTNAGYIFFHFSQQDLNDLIGACPEIVNPKPGPSWLPL